MHRGERRVGEGAHGKIVEANHGDIFGHANAMLAQRTHSTHGEDVVLGKESRRQFIMRNGIEPCAHVAISALERGAQRDAPCRIGLKACIFKRLAIAALAVLKIADAKVACQVADLLVALLDKVIHGTQHRIGVGNDYSIKVLAIAPAIEHDQVGGGVGEQSVVFLTQLGAHQHDGGSRVGDKALDLRAHGVQVAKIERNKARTHAVTTRLTLHALDNRRMEGTLIKDGARLAREHKLDALELRRLLVAERLRALENDLGGLLAHAALAIERVRYGRGREAGDSADLADTCFGHRSPLASVAAEHRGLTAPWLGN